MKFHKKQKRILLQNRNYDIPFVREFTIMDIEPLPHYQYQINNQLFTFKPKLEVLTYTFELDTLKFEGQINFIGLLWEKEYKSQNKILVRTQTGHRIWLSRDNEYDIPESNELWDEKVNDLD